MTTLATSSALPRTTPSGWTDATKVVRLLLLDRVTLTVLPWAILALSLAVNLAIRAMVPVPADQPFYSGGVSSIYIFVAIVGALAISRSLPFALELGLTRRRYYLGTLLTGALLAVANGVALTLLWWLEGVTGGWWLHVHYFRVPGLFAGSGWQTFGASLVLLVLFFVIGLWSGIVSKRWRLLGLVALWGGLVVILVLAAWLITANGWWGAFGSFFATTSIGALLAIALGVAVALAVGGWATLRRVTV